MNPGDAKTPGMASPRNASEGTLSQLRLIDRHCRQFEDDWRSGSRPSIEAILVACPDASSDPQLHDLLLNELIVLDVMLRTDSGESLRLESYLERNRTPQPL